MSDLSDLGVLYTEHSALTTAMPLASLWSYETRPRGHGRRSVTLNANGSQEYWLERSDPLLNTILPGTQVSLIFNFGDAWASGRSLLACELLPRACIAGPFTQPRLLRLGRSVHAVGAVISPTLACTVLGLPVTELVDRIVHLGDFWPCDEVERLLESLSSPDVRRSLSALRANLLARIGLPASADAVGETATRLIALHGGRVSIDAIARAQGLSRQEFARRFRADVGLPPKLFARITRFQALVHTMLSTDVARWAPISSSAGFYDQAHMINEFRAFAGAPPTIFFRPHGANLDPVTIQLRGRPCEWTTVE